MKKLGFGTMRLPQTDYSSVDIETFKKMVDAYMERGYIYFDTSYVYHMGNSETALREALVKRYPREAYTITDKMPTWMVQSKEDYKKYFNEQLERCGVEYFDYYWLHTLGSTLYESSELLGGFDFLKQMKAEGKIKHIGFSFHDTAETLDKILTDHPEIEFVQLIVNYIDWTNGGIEIKKSYDMATKHSVPVIAMEPVKGGVLSNVPKEIEEMFKEYNPEMSPASWAVRWVASLENVYLVLSGMSSVDQVMDNTSTFNDLKPLNDEEQKFIEKAQEILNKKAPNSCTYCGACHKVCPKNIAVPTYIGLYNNRKMFTADGWHNNVYDAVGERYGKASDCNNCRECEAVCPQKIKIAELLKDAVEVLKPLW
ncbi:MULTISPECIES: aldo/keto reductase [unclassified Clostridium]|uniref:aldo/keto reductase n=1 Tax=unclassified Clostridium TaxID=2614128 RepID=UPI0002985C48|nr:MULTISPECIES: aldo/keto reductase [unclassified Clostridium]EKQ57115.1 MAG: putative oxidoreductase of aldo/keto reductase family [Clostridium sp. Maddingley MBC34-26]